jgi:hypothetical protein
MQAEIRDNTSMKESWTNEWEETVTTMEAIKK